MKLAMEMVPSHVASVCATLDSKYNVCGGGREGGREEREICARNLSDDNCVVYTAVCVTMETNTMFSTFIDS